MKRNSIKTKSSILITVFLIGILTIFSGIFYVYFSKLYVDNIDELLFSQLDSVQNALENKDINQNFVDNLAEIGIKIFINTSTNSTDSIAYSKENINNIPHRILVAKTQNYEIKIGKSLVEFENTQQNFMKILLLLNIIFGIISFVVAYFVSYETLKPFIDLVGKLNKVDINNSYIKSDSSYVEVQQLYENFNNLLGKLSDDIKEKKEFLEDTSHELRTPIMTILTSLEFLENLQLPENKKNKLESIKYGAQKLERIVNELLFLAKGEQNQNIERIDIKALILNILGGLKNLIDEKNIDIVINGETFFIESQIIYVEKLFDNLIKNAIIYNNINGKLEIILEGNCVIIKDSGIGISQQNLDKIWERFYTNSRKQYLGGGIGLGLSIVKKIIDINSWKISLSSTIGEGTEFKIYFDKTDA